MLTRLIAILAICVLNSTLCSSAPPKELPWPQKGVTFPDNGVLDISIGSQDAPVVIHEISSVTCFHCAGFHKEVFPKLKEKYVDTGKVRLVIRHCPIDGVSMRAAMVLTQIPKQDRYPAIKKMWQDQPNWFPDDFSMKSLQKMSKQMSQYCKIPEEKAFSYLQDEKIAERIVKDRLALDKHIQIDGTPTFIINGDVVLVASTFENMDKLILEHLKAKGIN